MTPAPISVERLPAKWRKWADGLYRAEPANRIRDCADDLEAALPALLQQLAELSADRDGWKRIAESAIRDHEAAERAREEAEIMLSVFTTLGAQVTRTSCGRYRINSEPETDRGTARESIAAFLAASGEK